jgi:hypothetical protein
MGDEALVFIAGPMTPSAAATLRANANNPTNVVLHDARSITADDAVNARIDGWIGSSRVIILPSQHGAAGIERMADDSEDAVVEIAARRPAGRVVQADWLDAIAV